VDFGAVQDRAKTEGATFTVVGTYGYTPLEQFRGQAVAASDLYALGATLIHLLTGIAPAELSQKGLQIQFRDRVKLVPSFAHWLEVMTAPSPEHRFQTARQALAALEREVDDAPLLMAQRPRSTRVQLHVASDRLFIEIPRWHFSVKGAIARLLLFTLLFKLLTGMTNLLTSPNYLWLGDGAPWQIYLGVAIIWGLWLIGAIDTAYGLLAFQRFYRVQFDRHQFNIRQQWQNWCYQQEQGHLKDIQNVLPSVHIRAFNSFQVKDLQAEKEMLTIQTPQKKYCFGIGLSTTECAWLAQEIETWMLLQKYREAMAKNKHLTPQNQPQVQAPQAQRL
jgi:serine/threonine protein kinase